jgi:hypothetical protein
MPFLIHTHYRPQPYYTESQHIADDFVSWGYRVDFASDIEAALPQTQATDETGFSPDPSQANLQDTTSLSARRQINLRLNLSQLQPSARSPPSPTQTTPPSSLPLEQIWLNEYIAHMGPSTLEGVHAVLPSRSPLTSQNQNPPLNPHNRPITPNPSCLATLIVNMTRDLGAIASMVPGRNIVPFSRSRSTSHSHTQSRRNRSDQRPHPRGLI